MSHREVWFKEVVTAADLNDALINPLTNLKALAVDHGLLGIAVGLGVTQHYVGTTAAPDLTVDVAAGAAYDETGARMVSDETVNVDCSVDHLGVSTAVAAGNHRCVSVFARWVNVPSEAHTDGAGDTIYRKHDDGIEFVVYMGTETLLANPLDMPALMTGWVLLADITLINGQTQICVGDIDISRAQVVANLAGTPYSIRRTSWRDAVSDLLGYMNSQDLNFQARNSGGIIIPNASESRYMPCPWPSGSLYDLGGFAPVGGFTGKAVTVDAGTDTFTSAGHGLATGDPVHIVSSGGSPPAPLSVSSGAWYYVVNSTENTFQLAYYPGGDPINLSDAGSGVLTITHQSHKIVIPVAGKYRIDFWARFEAGAGGMREAAIFNSTGGVLERAVVCGPVSGEAVAHVTEVWNFTSAPTTIHVAVLRDTDDLDCTWCKVAVHWLGGAATT